MELQFSDSSTLSSSLSDTLEGYFSMNESASYDSYDYEEIKTKGNVATSYSMCKKLEMY